MARIRVFIAVDIGEGVRKKAAALQEKLARSAAGVKWVEPAGMHLTLLFLGEVEELEVVSICRVVGEQARALPAIGVHFGGLDAFPTPRRPKILWVGVHQGAQELIRLHDALEEPLLELGCYRREERAYSPHLTLGRLAQEDRAGSWGSILAGHEGWDGGSADVEEVLIMQSELRRDGPVYSVMGRAPLLGVPSTREEE
jgi:RNA 2',3'-cyclic 3'-phosphodiesterase